MKATKLLIIGAAVLLVSVGFAACAQAAFHPPRDYEPLPPYLPPGEQKPGYDDVMLELYIYLRDLYDVSLYESFPLYIDGEWDIKITE